MDAPASESPTTKRSSRRRAVIVVVLIIYGLSCAATIRTALPWCDEGWFADPAYNLLARGIMANSVLDPTFGFGAARVTGIDRHTYWVMPLYILVQSAWYRLTAPGLFSMRTLSLLWGLLTLAAWFSVLRALLHDSAVALAAVPFLALDFHFIWASSTGRMDMMTVALGFAAMAAYLRWRQEHFMRAVLASQSLMAAALFTHPCASLLFLDLVAIMLLFDARRVLRTASLAAAAAPYLLGLAGWAAYIMQDPHSFLAQFGGNAGSHYDALLFRAPWNAIQYEISTRYLHYYGAASYNVGLSRLKLLVLFAYLAALVGVLLIRELRRDPGYRLLLLFAAAHCFLLMALDSKKSWCYLLYVVPFFAAFMAANVVHCWRRRLLPRGLLTACCLAFLAVQGATTWSRVWRDDYDQRFLPVTRFLASHAGQTKLIMGPSELGFQLGFHSNLVDDTRLGCRSGKRADYIVVDKLGYASAIMFLKIDDPGCYRYVYHELAQNYRVVYEAGDYKIYERQS